MRGILFIVLFVSVFAPMVFAEEAEVCQGCQDACYNAGEVGRIVRMLRMRKTGRYSGGYAHSSAGWNIAGMGAAQAVKTSGTSNVGTILLRMTAPVTVKPSAGILEKAAIA